MFYDDSDHMSQSEHLNASIRQYAEAYGQEDTEREYILSPFDTWVKNPFYRGKPGRHPEDYPD